MDESKYSFNRASICDADSAAMDKAQAALERPSDRKLLNPKGRAGRRSAPRAAVRRSHLDVAVLVYDLRASGVVINAIRIAEAARQAGMATELWVIMDEGPLAEDLPAGLRLRRLRNSSSGLPRSVDSLMNISRLAALLRGHRPTVLFSAGNHVHAVAVLSHYLAKPNGTKLIGRVSNALAATVPPKQPGLTGRLLRAMAMRWERLQYGAMDRLIAVSHELASDLAQHGRVDLRAIAVIPNGVDADRIERSVREPVDHPWFAEEAPPVIIAVGRLCRQKNFEQLISAFALLRQTKTARLVILGSGSRHEHSRLLRLARDLDVQDDLWLAGYQPNPYRFMSRARLFVMTSRWEGGSNVLIEALACGLPVVATDCPAGVREVLAGCAAGRLVPIDDAEATADAMLDLLEPPHRLDESRMVAASYRLEHCLSRYQAILGSEAATRESAISPV